MIRKSNINDIPDILYLYNQITIKNMIKEVKNTSYDFEKYIENNSSYVHITDMKITGFILYFNHFTWGYIELICIDDQYRKINTEKKE